ncbi:hypothetical protein PGT21_027231 [Puccinia graminis f. sp. tritici]|uniref:Uncharacterized protein n=1 Tax=Puccinia graminis f. sp. tritici TaxID=56615 RepID=A0A5B0PUG9_PUCGR|nr:hypothetical protein PGTUg99_006797 [Puccinia graminis f. sp. tritici]KAA1104586.1 hypothetical protein PGT21_027231 [Puccinia graminis f. sp. tritici]
MAHGKLGTTHAQVFGWLDGPIRASGFRYGLPISEPVCGKSTSSLANNPSQNNLSHQQLISEQLQLTLEQTQLTLALTNLIHGIRHQINLMGHIQGQLNLTTKKKAHISSMVKAGMSHGQVARINLWAPDEQCSLQSFHGLGLVGLSKPLRRAADLV